MADLIAKSPCDGLLPISVGGLSLVEEDPGHLTTLAPFKGQDKALSAALEAAHGMKLPAPGRSTGKAGARAIWFGRDMVLLAGPAPDPSLAEYAALTDQSDAWAVVRLDGKGAEDVLARLCPIDLRSKSFKRGHTARTELRHMMASVTRTGANSFQIMVFRSLAQTLVHDLKTAMEAVAARG
ncbi:sarcosine oxidase subunit gamma [Phycobacter sp. K97]|uniref:sarcosine oxidase subunit gamma n=1 Tax=Phycobacter sedimenti TaxID=3133977 RepID=UPI00311E7846